MVTVLDKNDLSQLMDEKLSLFKEEIIRELSRNNSNNLKQSQEDKPLSIAEASKELKVSRQTISKWCKTGLLTSKRIGKRVYISSHEIRNIPK